MPKGFFVIADITGYTAFLTGSELDHAQDILKTLFETLLKQVKPPLVLSNFQGDAILTYAPDASFLQWETFWDHLENIYFEFAQTLEHMQVNTTCTCKACANMGSLDLKLFVHYGEYLLQTLMNREELSGPDVITVHRMMKNAVKEKTAIPAYLLISESALDVLQIPADFRAELTQHEENYEHLGAVPMRVYNLKTAWAEERENRHYKIDRDTAWLTVSIDVPLPLVRAWDYLNHPEYKRYAFHLSDVKVIARPGGRMGKGTVQHCFHGSEAKRQTLTILDWHPFEYITEKVTLPVFGATSDYSTCFEAISPTATRISFALASPVTSNPLTTKIVQLLGFLAIKRQIAKSILAAEPTILEAIAKERVSTNVE